MEHLDVEGKRQEFELKASPSEAEGLQPGSTHRVAYVPGIGDYALDDGHVILWPSLFAFIGLPLGLFLVGFGIWGKVPAYPR
jgi:hypothetical protein